MPKYRIFQSLFLTAFLVLVGLNFFFEISIWTYIILVVIALGIIVWGSSQINAQFFVKTICTGQKKGKKIALTFDDGPHPEITPKILDILKKHHAKATFFVIGKNISGNENLLKRIDSEGHKIGNHSLSHSYFFDFFSTQKVYSELKETQFLILKTTGKNPRFFRPPYGVTNPQISKAVSRLNYEVIGWDIRSFDTVLKSEEKIFKRIVQKLSTGNLLLFHETTEVALKVLEMLLEYLKKENYEVVSLEELIDREAYF